jgi:eukaryotic-like serine/threonine-protein kinase
VALTANLTPIREIGRGAFGVVYLATDPVHGEVAVKVIMKAAGETDAEWTAHKVSLLQEGQNLKKALHRNVVPVYQLLEQDTPNAMLLVMDYCAGGSLQPHFDAGPISIDRVLKVATEVTQGLQCLHGKGMIHRDIKPGNILATAAGVYKLADFGLVTDRLVLGYASQAGYWDHIAPEVHTAGSTSAKTDVWALGMTFYRLLHGKAWYEEDPRPVTLIPAGGFVDKLRWLPHVPAEWRRVIRAMLRDDPARRTATATAVFASLSLLPAGPSWDCQVTPAQVLWTRASKARRIHVVWDRLAKKHEWRAWSEPLSGTGRSMTLASSGGAVSRSQAEKRLREFFEGQT